MPDGVTDPLALRLMFQSMDPGVHDLQLVFEDVLACVYLARNRGP